MVNLSPWLWYVGGGYVALACCRTLYKHRYGCAQQLCVWYTLCRRRWTKQRSGAVAHATNPCPPVLDLSHSVTPGRCNQQTLFPHIKSVRFVPRIEDNRVEKQLVRLLEGWKVRHDATSGLRTTRATHTISLYDELVRQAGPLPEEIHVQLDKPLNDLLNIKLPVQSSTGGYYVLTADSVETLVLAGRGT